MPTLRRQGSRRTNAARTIQRSFRSRRAPARKSWFGTKRAKPEMKRKHTTVEDQSITGAAAYQQLFGVDAIAQGLTDDSRIGSRITAKYLSSKFLFDNQSDNKAMLLRYVIWSPKSTTQTLALTGTNFINTKLFKVWKQGYVSVNHDSARVMSVSIPMRNKVFEFSGHDTTIPISQDRIYLTMTCVTSGMALKFTHNTAFYYVDN